VKVKHWSRNLISLVVVISFNFYGTIIVDWYWVFFLIRRELNTIWNSVEKHWVSIRNCTIWLLRSHSVVSAIPDWNQFINVSLTIVQTIAWNIVCGKRPSIKSKFSESHWSLLICEYGCHPCFNVKISAIKKVSSICLLCNSWIPTICQIVGGEIFEGTLKEPALNQQHWILWEGCVSSQNIIELSENCCILSEVCIHVTLWVVQIKQTIHINISRLNLSDYFSTEDSSFFSLPVRVLNWYLTTINRPLTPIGSCFLLGCIGRIILDWIIGDCRLTPLLFSKFFRCAICEIRTSIL